VSPACIGAGAHAAIVSRWSRPSSYQCEAMSLNPFGPAQAMFGSTWSKTGFGMLLRASPRNGSGDARSPADVHRSRGSCLRYRLQPDRVRGGRLAQPPLRQPRGVAARPPPRVSEDTDQVVTDAPAEFRQPAQAVIVVNVGARP